MKTPLLLSPQSSVLLLIGRAAADEVDDLDAVAFAERRALPVGAAEDFAVEFDGEALGFERELFDETFDGQPSAGRVLFPVDDDAQILDVP